MNLDRIRNHTNGDLYGAAEVLRILTYTPALPGVENFSSVYPRSAPSSAVPDGLTSIYPAGQRLIVETYSADQVVSNVQIGLEIGRLATIREPLQKADVLIARDLGVDYSSRVMSEREGQALIKDINIVIKHVIHRPGGPA